MSKEKYNQIIDEVYEIYINKLNYNEKDCHVDDLINKPNKTFVPYNQDEFTNKCKSDPEFSEKWGLKIEERKLSLQERSFLANSNHYEVSQNIKMFVRVDSDHTLHEYLDDEDIPTKQITLTYQNEKIEVYE
jgi:hypothetical protein